MKTEITIPLPLPASRYREEAEYRNKIVSYGERWLEYYGLKGDVHYVSPIGIEAEVDREEIERICHAFYAEMCEEDRDDYHEFRVEVTRWDEVIDCTNLMLEFMDQMGEFNHIAETLT